MAVLREGLVLFCKKCNIDRHDYFNLGIRGLRDEIHFCSVCGGPLEFGYLIEKKYCIKEPEKHDKFIVTTGIQEISRQKYCPGCGTELTCTLRFTVSPNRPAA